MWERIEGSRPDFLPLSYEGSVERGSTASQPHGAFQSVTFRPIRHLIIQAQQGAI
jgi:hypothetical protein